ncbi:PREDICTED: oxysterol-binding protein-related protein 1B [Tarenaya hassleriana]|uniref:oxysterol-binding protein-related protein 1B n=1 Tax=Tarenaya hassleriana TaxID=28532 RepID=UPI00053C7893|nr:PREDICTED: oxysterol-binding protein-related protein 1B [Tarenaya hassleriana]
MEARVVSQAACGNDKVVKIVVSSRKALAKYKPERDETTVVVADDVCSDKDMDEIKTYCDQLGYEYEGRLNEEYEQGNVGPGLV